MYWRIFSSLLILLQADSKRKIGFYSTGEDIPECIQKKARENPYVLECERSKKQKLRQDKRKFNDSLDINLPRKRFKHDTDTLPKSHQKYLITIEESIKQFHNNISIGPL